MSQKEWLEKLSPFLTQDKKKVNSRRVNSLQASSLIEEAKLIDYPWIASIKELFVCVTENITKQPLCECGEPCSFKRTYNSTCGKKECHSKINGSGWNKGLTKEDHPGIAAYGRAVSEKKKGRSLTEKERAVIDKMAEINRSREYDPVQFERYRKTNLERYGVESYLSIVHQDGRNAIIEKYGNWYQCSEEYTNEIRDRIQRKLENTNLKKYGFKRATQNPKVDSKRCLSRKENGTFNSSAPEENFFNFLKEYFSEYTVHRQYVDKERYPFDCDFYIEEIDLFVELNLFWTHGGEPYDETLQRHVDRKRELIEKSKTSKFYEIALNVWTKSDVKKLRYALENNLNYIQLYDSDYSEIEFLENLGLLKEELSLSFSKEELFREIELLCSSERGYSTPPNTNKLVLENQWKNFFRKELDLWPEVKRKLYANRIQYLKKDPDKITDFELLRGFKVSAIHYGYSHFSPYWIKKFIEEYNIQSLYDPTGGWGHRLLGAMSIDYIYNDLSKDTYEGVLDIENFLKENFSTKIGNHKLYNEDASKFIPAEEYEAVFTCPPYFNVEDYGIGSFSSIEEYRSWWKRVVTLFTKDSTRIAGIVIGSDYVEDIKSGFMADWEFTKEIPIGKQYLSHMHNSNKRDILLVFQR